jgi:hypothetical protein
MVEANHISSERLSDIIVAVKFSRRGGRGYLGVFAYPPESEGAGGQKAEPGLIGGDASV